MRIDERRPSLLAGAAPLQAGGLGFESPWLHPWSQLLCDRLSWGPGTICSSNLPAIDRAEPLWSLLRIHLPGVDDAKIVLHNSRPSRVSALPPDFAEALGGRRHSQTPSALFLVAMIS